jgi:phytase-like protein
LGFGLGTLSAALAAVAVSHGGGQAFDHAGTFDVPANLRSGEPIDTVTAAEIVDATPDGRTLVYTDSPTGRLGFVDIRRPSAPAAAGTLDMGGEPTSVATIGRKALVAVNTSASFTNPTGELAIVDTSRRRILDRIPLAGQPDSVDISPDERYAAIVIENERDEDVNDGLIPQAPPGALQILDLRHMRLRTVALTGLADYAPSDPEPEYVDINEQNEAVVSLQENNHLAIVDIEKSVVRRHFPAGSVTLADVDATEEELGPQGNGVIELSDTITRRREPDAVKWIDRDTFATANEGDYTDENGDEGGSRGFTLFNERGWVEYESGASFEHEIVRAGHFPQGRAADKGNEPEGLEVASFGRRQLLFVGSERANVVGVYDLGGRTPEFLHVLPTGVGPEGVRAIPKRDLLAVSAEEDLIADGLGIRSLITLYELDDRPDYPNLVSAGREPIPWVAMSGLAGDPRDDDTLWAVSDSILAQAYIYRVDVSRRPAVIERRIPVGGFDLDVEGIAARPEGGFWLASEGRTNVGSARPNLLVRTDASGAVLDTVELPAGLVAGATSSGFEGVAVTGSERRGDETVWAVIQREWADDTPGFVKLARYDVADEEWTFARYPLDPVESPAGGWVGLSELTLLPDGEHVAIVERDDRIAQDARVKRIYGVDLEDVDWRPHGQPLDTVRKRLLRDVLDELDERSISVPDKLEGLGVTDDGRMFLATDNDGVDENYGETLFFNLAWPHRGGPWR